MLDYKISLEPDEEISAICAIENIIAMKTISQLKLKNIEPLADFQKKEIKKLNNFLKSLKNKQLIGG